MSNPNLIAVMSNNLSGEIYVPGDKSISHRAIILSLLSEGNTIIKNILMADDIKNTIEVSKALGSDIRTIENDIEVVGLGIDGLKKPNNDLDFGNSGTSIRLFMGILCNQNFSTILTGDNSLIKRPMERVAKPLRLMGANIFMNNETAPITISAPRNKLRGITYHLDIPSAQIKSAILLSSLFINEKTLLKVDTQTRNHTENMFRLFSYPIEIGNNSIEIFPGNLKTPKSIDVPGDFSSASFFILAALLAKNSKLIIRDVGLNPTRTGLISILKLMGADILINITKNDEFEPVGDIEVKSSSLKGIEVPYNLISLSIDELPLVFLAAAYANGKTSIRNAKELRYKESDRIKSMVSMLRQFSIEVLEYHDGVTIQGGKITGGEVNSFGDHRIAMTALVASCISKEPIVVKNCENINTSFPSFVALMNSVGMNITSNKS
jgi:3-phosphoshikimate 1-carboxyvinyltransferase